MAASMLYHEGFWGGRATRRYWWKEASIYQIYPASFHDSNGDGIGDIAGIRQKLPYIKTLGVDAVWLCPVYQSPQADMGYDISDYRAIHSPYGTMGDIEDLIEGLHQNGMKLIMDLVVNHTSDQHIWFKESKSSLTSAKRDWYIWRKPVIDELGHRHPPNNWASIFGGSAWTFDHGSGEYYLHLFRREQPDLNWENPEVIYEVHQIIEFWLQKGVDGFRMDVINLISKTPGLPNAPINDASQQFQPAHMHYAYGPRLHEHLRGLRTILDRYDAFAVGEMPWVNQEDQVLETVADHKKELNLIFQFDIVDIDIGSGGKFSANSWTLDALKKIVEKWQTCMYEGDGWNALFLENHDQSRSVSRFTPHRPENRCAAAKVLATFIGFQAGTLFIYQGQELGMANLPDTWPIDEYKDFETQNLYQLARKQFENDEAGFKAFLEGVHSKARDHARSPVQWNSTAHGGFSTSKPWMRVNDDYVDHNAEMQLSDSKSVFSFWQRVLQLRKQYKDVLVYGRFEMMDQNHPWVMCYQRIHHTTRAVVIMSFSDIEQQWTMPPEVASVWKDGKQLLANYTTSWVVRGHSVCLRPFEAAVMMHNPSEYHL